MTPRVPSSLMQRLILVLMPISLMVHGCGGPARPVPELPRPTPVRPGPQPDLQIPDAGGLPAIPVVDGPLELRVTYPPAGRTVGPVDSSFILGSTGTGGAHLTINGQQVEVHPNGSWLAWVPFPRDTLMRFNLRAERGDASVELVHVVRRLPEFIPMSRVWVDTTSFEPKGRVWWPINEPLSLSVRAVAGAEVRLVAKNGDVIPFQAILEVVPVAEGQRAFSRETPQGATVTQLRYVAAVSGRAVGDPLPLLDDAEGQVTGGARLEVILGGDTTRVIWPLRLTLLSAITPVVALDDDRDRTGLTDGLTPGRTVPGGTYYWFFPQGTRVTVTGRVNQDLRVRLADGVESWVPVLDALPLLQSAVINSAVVGFPSALPGNNRVTVRIPLTYRAPYRVVEEERAVRLRFYHAVGDPNWIRYGPTHGPLTLVTWQQETSDQVEFRFQLDRPLWGYRLKWEGSDLLLEMRGPPPIDPEHPLAGRRIAIDAGHPPGGSTGPTGLPESVANLAVADRLAVLLREAGAEVVLTRPDTAALDLWPRVVIAEESDADVLVSIHNNALPDGVNPFLNHGTSVYYFHPRGLALARAVQRELVARLGEPDLGVGRGDLALVRGTWIPSILAEGLFLIMPHAEAALGSEAGQTLYAQAVFRGIFTFLSRIETP